VQIAVYAIVSCLFAPAAQHKDIFAALFCRRRVAYATASRRYLQRRAEGVTFSPSVTPYG